MRWKVDPPRSCFWPIRSDSRAYPKLRATFWPAMEGSSVSAVLGPTNTGKTHRAIERMLEFESGMIGLPLRLLAREVYDKITARIGEARVALVTGEEKRVPRRPDYWVCTVEAMPMDREVDFVAVDEIQLAAHAQRGHVFTERLLHARGKKETWFLGAGTMKPIVAELLPAAKIIEHPRLSRLSFAGGEKLTRLPARSAVVAFSMAEVYEVGERLRALRGGAAIVLGALSPRTRNAQVAMFQSGEVDYLVATDAIGMGLNLDVKHVAFASLRKFDGREVRDLEPAELGQIAGRAGRYTADGSFGTVAPARLPDGLALAVEEHRFSAVRKLFWRNSDLDTTSLDTLLASLKLSSHKRTLKLQDTAEDAASLARLAQDPAIRARVRGKEVVELLWDVCQIPDYRKLLFESHVALLAEIFHFLAGPKARLDEDWLHERITEIDDPSGDIETLIAKIATIRTWTYVSHRGLWVKDPVALQEQTSAIEDRLSDALHERLVQRFVEKTGRAQKEAVRPALKAKQQVSPQTSSEKRVAEPGNPFEKLATWKISQAKAHLAAASDEARFIEALISATHDKLHVDAEGRIVFEGKTPVGQLVRGASLLLPDVRVLGMAELGAGARTRVHRRLVAFARDFVEAFFTPLRIASARKLGPAGRGIVYQLEQGLGTALTESAAGQMAELSPEDREKLLASGIVLGERVLWVSALLRQTALEQRAALIKAYACTAKTPHIPKASAVSMPVDRAVAGDLYTLIGYPRFGPRAVRADVAEKVVCALQSAEENQPIGRFSSWLGCSAKEAAQVVLGLGFSFKDPTPEKTNANTQEPREQ